MIEGITTPTDHIDTLTSAVNDARLMAADHNPHINEYTPDQIRAQDAATSTLRDVYQHYIGALGLLSSLAVELREGNDENRDLIENAIVDAISLGAPLNYKRVLDRIDIGVNEPVEEDLEV